jgi:hypothetical protein
LLWSESTDERSIESDSEQDCRSSQISSHPALDPGSGRLVHFGSCGSQERFGVVGTQRQGPRAIEDRLEGLHSEVSLEVRRSSVRLNENNILIDRFRELDNSERAL